MSFETHNLSLGYDQRLVVEELDLQIELGKITSIIGANGSGKSTILRALARLLKPKIGAVLLGGQAIHQLPTKKVAQQLAILPQTPIAPEGLTVEALVQFGRYPHQGFWQQAKPQDLELIEMALNQTKMTALRTQLFHNLSGGQKQRAWIAFALAQNTPILLLDEPTTHLDIMHQLEVLHLLEELNAKTGKTVVMVLHDLNQAAQYSHQIIAVQHGKVVAQDSPEKVLTLELLRQVFGIEVHLLQHPSSGKPHVIPYELAKYDS